KYYSRSHAQFLGKRVTIRGKIRKARRVSRSAVLTGRIVESSDHEHIFGFVFSPVRVYIDRLLNSLFEDDQYSIASGLTLGGSGRLRGELREVFSRAGTLHVLAVSGLHVGFVGAFFGAVLLFIPLDYRVKFIIVVCALLVYAGVSGFRPSVCRATLMAFLFGLALVSQRNVESMHILNITAIVFLVFDPLMLFDVGAQLSFAAVYGILYLYPRFEDRIIGKVRRRPWKVILRMMAVSLSAQLFVAPLLIYYFNRLPVYAVFANLLVVPLASVVIFLLFLCFSVGWICSAFARMIAVPAGILIYVLKAFANFFAALPLSSLEINVSPLFTFLIYFVAWKRIRFLVLCIMLVLAFLLSIARSVDCLVVCESPRGILIGMPGDTKILLTKRFSHAQREFLQKHGVDVPDYLIAENGSHSAKLGFIQWPEDLQSLGFEYGDLQIAICDRLQIRYGNCMMEYPRVYFAGRAEGEEIRYMISNGRTSYFVEGQLYNTVLEQMIVDLRTTMVRIRLLF
ncbi:MAG: ComEC/Rec2 family competence protein, partial [candidate division WOR-3 bacterium]